MHNIERVLFAFVRQCETACTIDSSWHRYQVHATTTTTTTWYETSQSPLFRRINSHIAVGERELACQVPARYQVFHLFNFQLHRWCTVPLP